MSLSFVMIRRDTRVGDKLLKDKDQSENLSENSTRTLCEI